MHQTVTTREDVHERTELGDVHHATRIGGAHLGHRRRHDRQDASLGLFHAERLDGTDGDDADGTVVVHRDVGTGLLLDGVDDLALRPDDLTDLVHRDGDRDDLRRRGRHFGTRRTDRGVHVVEDRRTGFLRLLERCDEDIGGDALDLGVELQGRDGVGRAGHLEVHVAECVLGTEDVGEGDVLALGVHEAHGDAGHGGLDRHTGVHEGEAAGADRGHAGGAVRGEHLGHEAQRVAELVLAGEHGQQRTGGERTVADLATLGRTDSTRLTVGPRGHVVVEQEVLVGLGAESVHQLVHAWHGHGDDIHHLGLATLEQTGAMSGGQYAHFTAERTQVTRATTVDAHALVDDALAHGLLGEAADGFLDLAFTTGECAAVGGEFRDGGSSDGVGGGVALGLAGDGDCGLQTVGERCHGIENVLAVVGRLGVLHRLDRSTGGHDRSDELTLQADRLLDPHLAGLEAAGEDGFVHLGGAAVVVGEALGGAAGFDHHDRDVAAVELTPGHDQLERGGRALFVRGVRDPFAGLAEGDADGADGAVERDAGDHQRRRSGVDAEHVVRVGHVGAEDGEDHLGLVTEALGERRPQRTVGEATSEDRVLGGAAFTTEERTGDLAGSVRTLLDVDREREEVGAGTDVLGSVRGGEDRGSADAGHHGTLALLSQLAGLERQGLVGARNGTRHSNGICHVELLSVGRVFSHASTVGAEAGSQSARPALRP